MDHEKIDAADLDSARKELSVHGLGFVVALLVCQEIVFCGHMLGEHLAVCVISSTVTPDRLAVGSLGAEMYIKHQLWALSYLSLAAA